MTDLPKFPEMSFNTDSVISYDPSQGEDRRIQVADDKKLDSFYGELDKELIHTYLDLPFDIDSVISFSALQDEERIKRIYMEGDMKWLEEILQSLATADGPSIDRILPFWVFCWAIIFSDQKPRNVHPVVEVFDPISNDDDSNDLSDNNLDYLDTYSDDLRSSLTSKNWNRVAKFFSFLTKFSLFVEAASASGDIDKLTFLLGLFLLILFNDFEIKNPRKFSNLLAVFNPSGLLDQRSLVVEHFFDDCRSSIKFAQSRFIVLRIFKPDGTLLEICDAIQRVSPDGSICMKKLSIICGANERRYLFYLNSQDAWLKFLATLDSYFSGTKIFPFQDYTRYHQRSQQINEIKLSASIVLESYIVNLISFNESLNNLYSGTNTKMLKSRRKNRMKALVDSEGNDSKLVNRKIQKKKRSYEKRSLWWKKIQNITRQELIELSKEKREKQLQKEGK